MPMTQEQIEEALEQPEHLNPLVTLAKARIAVAAATGAHNSALGIVGDDEARLAYLQILDDGESDFFDSMAGPFEDTFAGEDTPAEIIKAFYDDLVKRFRSSEYRMKEAASQAQTGATS